ncbi:hypothetical protein KAS24_01670, partial [Candidatus Bathyarchaeota archaeon]|nr:hypothetical protein [Candidatus Bathyarchaeota archaeon]
IAMPEEKTHDLINIRSAEFVAKTFGIDFQLIDRSSTGGNAFNLSQSMMRRMPIVISTESQKDRIPRQQPA